MTEAKQKFRKIFLGVIVIHLPHSLNILARFYLAKYTQVADSWNKCARCFNQAQQFCIVYFPCNQRRNVFIETSFYCLHRSEDIENRLQNSPSVQKHYPTPIPPLLSPRYQNYGHPFGISMYDAPSPPLPASFRLQNRARRRSENKKCRKVYGIENRDIWCTQCKWKKACTRFTNNDKGDRPEMAFLADYAGLQYPA